MMPCPRCWGTQIEPQLNFCKECSVCHGAGNLPDAQLSEHFWLSELLESDTAIRRGIPNDPTPEQLENLEELVTDVLEPVRKAAGFPIVISSGLRGDPLNAAIRGASKTSAHRKGSAGDAKPANRRKVSIPDLVEIVIASKVPFDQVILEPTWVHLGRRGPGGSVRGQKLMMFRELDEGASSPEKSIYRSRYYPLDLDSPRVVAMRHG